MRLEPGPRIKACTRAFIFFCKLMRRKTCRTSQFSFNRLCIVSDPQISVIMVVRKLGSFFFFFFLKTYFQPKIPRKHSKNLVKPIHNLQKHKNRFKTQNQLETKKLPELKSIFFVSYMVSKTPNLNSSYHIEPLWLKKKSIVLVVEIVAMITFSL
jgi:hypothetical protein